MPRQSQPLITGANGFIGKHLKGKHFQGDVSSYEELWEQSKGCSGIIHLAAESNKRECEAEPLRCIETNLVGAYNVLEVALNQNLWVLFISTFQVTEVNLYGISKLFGEELCRLYRAKGVNLKILRLPIVYGPNDRDYKVVTKIIKQVKNGIEPLVEDRSFNFMYVDDVARRIENEGIVLDGGWGEKHSLTDLVAGIKECVHAETKK